MNKFAPRPLEQRFKEKYSVREDGCWQWTAAIDSAGYGRIVFNGKLDGAHRISWRIANGMAPVPGGRYILHRCNNKRCVNPDHLYAGTPSDNVNDAIRDGLLRHDMRRKPRPYQRPDHRGALNPRAKLLPEQVEEIRRRYSAGNVSQQRLADEYGVKQMAISRAIRRVSWAA